jgi:hypothetical protein
MVEPVQKSSPSYSPSEQEQDHARKQQLQMNDAMNIFLFFIQLWKQQGDAPEGDSDSLQGKIQRIEKELEQGKISINVAASEIMNLLQRYEQKQNLQFPQFNFQDPKSVSHYAERVADQVFAFQSFVKYMIEKEDPSVGNILTIADKISHLGDNILSGKINPEEGLSQLIGTINNVNEQMSPSLQYPTPITFTAYE